MFNKIKQCIVTMLINAPVISYYFYKYYVFRKPLNEKALRGKIQYLGHCIDLDFSNCCSMNKAKIYELKYHFKTFIRSKYQIDESILWAMNLLMCYQYNTVPGYTPTRVSLVPEDLREFDRIIKERRSVRKWLQAVVSDADISRAVEWATWAPSSCNRQPWQVMVFKNETDKKEFTKYFSNSFYTTAPILLLVLIESSVYSGRDKHFIYLDAGAFIQNLLLGFHAMGLGACWIGFKGWNAIDDSCMASPEADSFYNYFGIDKELVPISLIAVGHPAALPNAPARQSPQNVMTYFDNHLRD